MDSNTTVVYLGCIAAVVYMFHLLLTKKGDIEAGGRGGAKEFFLRAKERKK